ncbi:MAG: sulfur carrier protein ThiS [Desulfovibrio sp.]|jgi:sulfur carrier protein|nr:sulfur carrier protein ThiS [Desulfovibrio sp.]
MELRVNGEKEIFERSYGIVDVLAARGDDISRVVVELNGNIVSCGEFAGTSLKEGDVLEIVHLVGGG